MSSMENADVPHAFALEPVVDHDRRLRVTCFPSPPGLQVEGDLDRLSLPALVRSLDSIPGDSDAYVNLAGLRFIDVGGLRALVVTAAQFRDGHVLALRSAPPRVRRLLDLTGWREAPGLRLDATTPRGSTDDMPRPVADLRQSLKGCGDTHNSVDLPKDI
ncbi:STAS domain-containing protein [Planomonospora sp. ID67723]|uniref:STAS domain-containing protein n=1 Tax=Planomonospora sp. ID67723 TaxID=2738134 RepID=UPI0018C3B07A|nr:STAS domain-containing protein [Planomonospora sp. ID67723]MBG0826638.1 STAS domain-containing protein [Planomonospora sp. ID67723]